MDRRTSRGLFGITGAALLLGLLSTAACSAPAPDDAAGGTASSVTERPFDRNAVLDDKSMRDAETLTVAAVCNDSYRGFANQAECAAGTMRRTMDKALTASGTVSGWSRGKSKDTEDGITIVPKNAVTAALYTYTPWVGEAGGGKKGVGGVSLHAQVWDSFAESVSYGAWAVPSAGGASNAASADGADAGADSSAPDPVQDPAPAEPDPAPEADAGSTTSDPDASTGNGDNGSGADAGPTGEGTPTTSGSKGAPENGSDDGAIIGEGSAPTSSNAAPPSTRTKTPSKPEELPAASDGELAGKSKSSAGGCSTTGHDGSPDGWLIAGAAALAIASSRRRRR